MPDIHSSFLMLKYYIDPSISMILCINYVIELSIDMFICYKHPEHVISMRPIFHINLIVMFR